jgi:hypothetical protein
MPLNIDDVGSRYPEHYITEAKILWYKKGKPRPQGLYEILPVEPISGMKPKITTLREWIYKDWKEWADEMDQVVTDEIQGRLIEEKVAMFIRFTELGKEMQDIAMTWLRDEANKGKMNAIAVVRLLVDGIQTEKEARGVPQVLRKMLNATDEDLLKRAKQLIEKAPIEFETININEETQNGDL